MPTRKGKQGLSQTRGIAQPTRGLGRRKGPLIRKRQHSPTPDPSAAPSCSSSRGSDGDYWYAAGIIKEFSKPFRQYLIRWKGLDPETKKAWPDSKEPRKNLNPALLEEWEQWKRQNPDGKNRGNCFALGPGGWVFLPSSQSCHDSSSQAAEFVSTQQLQTQQTSDSSPRPLKRRRIAGDRVIPDSYEESEPDSSQAAPNSNHAQIVIDCSQEGALCNSGLAPAAEESYDIDAALEKAVTAPSSPSSTPFLPSLTHNATSHLVNIQNRATPPAEGHTVPLNVDDTPEGPLEQAAQGLHGSSAEHADLHAVADSASQQHVSSNSSKNISQTISPSVSRDGSADIENAVEEPAFDASISAAPTVTLENILVSDPIEDSSSAPTKAVPKLRGTFPAAPLQLGNSFSLREPDNKSFHISNSRPNDQEAHISACCTPGAARISSSEPSAVSSDRSVATNQRLQTILTPRPPPSRQRSPPPSETIGSPSQFQTPSTLPSPPPESQNIALDSQAPLRPATPSIMASSPNQETLNHSASNSSFARTNMSGQREEFTRENRPEAWSRPQAASSIPQDTARHTDRPARDTPSPLKADYYVPFPMFSHARETWKNYLLTHRDSIERFLVADVQKAAELRPSIISMLRGLRDIESHVDLIDEQLYTQYDDTQQTQWSLSTNSKFRFLDTLLKAASEADRRVAIYVKSGRLFDSVKCYLNTQRVNWYLPASGHAPEEHIGGLVVELRSSAHTELRLVSTNTDLVIGFDETFDPNDSGVMQVRTGITGKIKPAIILVPIFGLAHLEMSLGMPQNTEDDYLRVLLTKLVALRDIVGRLPFQLPKAEEFARSLADALVHDDVADWVNTLPDIPAFDIGSRIASTASSSRSSLDGTDASIDGEKRAGDKRQAQFEPENTPVKRVRIASSAANPSPTESQEQTEGIVVTPDEVERLKREAALAQEARQKERELEHDLSDLQERLEGLSRLHAESQKQLKTTEQEKQAANERILKLQIALDTVKEERFKMRSEVEHARKSLAESSISDLQEFEKIRKQAAQVATLEKKLAAQQQTADYVTEQYQGASNAASEQASELRQLRSENEQLRLKADSKAREYLTLFQNQLHGKTTAHLKRASMELSTMTALLNQKNQENQELREEIKNLREREGNRLGMNTRSGSARASSQGPSNNGMSLLHSARQLMAAGRGGSSRPASRASSRQASPLPTNRTAAPMNSSNLRD